MFFSSRARVATPTAEVHAPEFDPMALVGLLTAVVGRRELPSVEGLPPILVETIRSLDAAIAARDSAMLESAVGFSMKASEAMAATAVTTTTQVRAPGPPRRHGCWGPDGSGAGSSARQSRPGVPSGTFGTGRCCVSWLVTWPPSTGST